MQYNVIAPWIHIIVNERFQHKTINDFLDYYKQSKKRKYLLFLEKHILLNNKETSPTQHLQANDKLSIYYYSEILPTYSIRNSLPISIAYEDEFLLIVNKPPHVLIHSDGTTETTLSDFVQAYYQQTKQPYIAHPIHRLDKETSGLVIFCKILFFQPYFDHLLKQKNIHREYIAIAKGTIPLQQSIVVNQPIGRDRHDARKNRISKSGKEAYTTFKCTRHIGGNSLVYCTLKTGRTHQIRIHLASINHPILSDVLYGTKDTSISRLALHAYKITWIHPISQQVLQVETKLPDDMQNMI